MVWAILIRRSFHMLNRLVGGKYRPNLEALVCQLVKPAFDGLDWGSRPGESPLILQLRADLLRSMNSAGWRLKGRRRRLKTFIGGGYAGFTW